MTKFDVWLNQHCTAGEIVSILFKHNPLGIGSGAVVFDVKIFTVDRYHVYLEIDLSETDVPEWSDPVWVAKDNIISAQ